MARVTINNVEIEAPEGATILDAAEQAGVAIPTLCSYREIGAITSCMVCVVKDLATGRMAPACATRVADGMRIDTACEEVVRARREILRMLLSEHVGDCDGPCARICPAALNVPRMLRHIAAGDMAAAARLAREELVFPRTLGLICPAPCKKGCRRGLYDEAIDIPGMHRAAAEAVPPENMSKPVDVKRRVAVVGAGIAGLASAAVCLRNGIACTVYEKRDVACHSLRDLPQLPREALDSEIEAIVGMGAEIRCGCEVGKDIDASRVIEEADIVIVACDAAFPEQHNVLRAKEERLHVRSVAQGKTAGYAAVALLTNSRPHNLRREFSYKIGKLNGNEIAAYAVERVAEIRQDLQGCRLEASRCLHCDCRKSATCKLRQYAEEYGVSAEPNVYIAAPQLKPILRHGDLLFESGKCVKCGICVELLRKRGMHTALTHIGRGAASLVAPPFFAAMEELSGDLIEEIAGACPTGAIAVRGKEEDTA